jgi:hypothetical protein
LRWWRREIEGAGSSGSFFVGEMKVDHGGGDVGMSENVLCSSFHERFGPVFKVRVGFGGKTEVDESCAELFPEI